MDMSVHFCYQIYFILNQESSPKAGTQSQFLISKAKTVPTELSGYSHSHWHGYQVPSCLVFHSPNVPCE